MHNHGQYYTHPPISITPREIHSVKWYPLALSYLFPSNANGLLHTCMREHVSFPMLFRSVAAVINVPKVPA